jgi:hypothetical protein
MAYLNATIEGNSDGESKQPYYNNTSFPDHTDSSQEKATPLPLYQ